MTKFFVAATVILMLALAPVAKADTSVSVGNTTSSLVNGSTYRAATVLGQQTGQPAPFDSICGSDAGASTNCVAQWTFHYASLGAQTITGATLTLGIWDIDSGAAGSPVKSFNITNGEDLTTSLNVAAQGIAAGAGAKNSEFDIFTLTLSSASFNALASGTLTVSLSLQSGLGVLGPAPSNGAGLVFSTLDIQTGGIPQTITFSNNAPTSAVYNSSFTVAATGGASGNAVSFTSAGSCSNVGATYTMTSGTGTCSVIANQAGNSSYAAAATVTETVNAQPANQTISFGPLSGQLLGSAPFTVSATTNSGLTVSFNSLATPSVCSVSLGTVTLLTVGTCTIQATQAGNTNYTAASPVNQSFQVSQTATNFVTSPAGLLVSVDGSAAQAAPFTVMLSAGSHTIAVATTQAGGVGTQYVFSNWSDSGAASHSITVGAPSITYTAAFQTQYQLTTAASPTAGGTVTPASGAFYNAGSVVPVQEAANGGYQFASFSGALTGSTSPQNVTMNGPENVVANFTPLAPQMSASVGARTVVSGTQLSVGLTLTNTGLGMATNATITSITAIADVAGSGSVTVASGALPLDLGTINSGSAASTVVLFNWPSTATRVRFTVNFTADGGYTGSTTITTLY